MSYNAGKKIERAENERHYADRVTAVYRRIEEKLGKEEAEVVSEMVRGVAMLDESVGLLERIEKVSDDDLLELVSSLVVIVNQLEERFDESSFYVAMKKLKAVGRTRLMYWNGVKYIQVQLEEEALKQFPWAGEIRGNGPSTGAEGIVMLGRDIKLEYRDGYIVLNGTKYQYWIEWNSEV